MQVILGKNVWIEFYKEGDYRFFGCAENVEFNQQTATKSTRTLTSGYWANPRAQSNSYSISLTGLLPEDTSTYSTPLDLMEYQRQMVPIEFRIIFENEDGTEYHQIRGLALITDGQLTGPVDFAGSSFTMVGVGEPLFGAPPSCSIEIFDFEVIHDNAFIYEARVLGELNGPALRYDWSLDGGAEDTAMSTGWFMTITTLGDHQLRVWPICANGARGTQLTYDFTLPLP